MRRRGEGAKQRTDLSGSGMEAVATRPVRPGAALCIVGGQMGLRADFFYAWIFVSLRNDFSLLWSSRVPATTSSFPGPRSPHQRPRQGDPDESRDTHQGQARGWRLSRSLSCLVQHRASWGAGQAMDSAVFLLCFRGFYCCEEEWRVRAISTTVLLTGCSSFLC
jgi:hypothetical protein